jgi:hypothetical protein
MRKRFYLASLLDSIAMRYVFHFTDISCYLAVQALRKENAVPLSDSTEGSHGRIEIFLA